MRKFKKGNPFALTKKEIASYLNGISSLRSIGVANGVCGNTVKNALLKMGCKIRKRGLRKGQRIWEYGLSKKLNRKRESKILSMFDRGIFLSAIGEKFGLTRERVRQIAKINGRMARRKMHKQFD